MGEEPAPRLKLNGVLDAIFGQGLNALEILSRMKPFGVRAIAGGFANTSSCLPLNAVPYDRFTKSLMSKRRNVYAALEALSLSEASDALIEVLHDRTPGTALTLHRKPKAFRSSRSDLPLS